MMPIAKLIACMCRYIWSNYNRFAAALLAVLQTVNCSLVPRLFSVVQLTWNMVEPEDKAKQVKLLMNLYNV